MGRLGSLGGWGIVGRLGFRVGVSASYRYFCRVPNFDFVYTAAVSLPLVKNFTVVVRYPTSSTFPVVKLLA